MATTNRRFLFMAPLNVFYSREIENYLCKYPGRVIGDQNYAPVDKTEISEDASDPSTSSTNAVVRS